MHYFDAVHDGYKDKEDDKCNLNYAGVVGNYDYGCKKTQIMSGSLLPAWDSYFIREDHIFWSELATRFSFIIEPKDYYDLNLTASTLQPEW
ncbi:unnamed protein product [Protopolystoma xenopodis]|uniref:Uncharacterized protein n=1 Tax=Protopolystoma xenopodis TaxID=117903 RepID=A0A448WCL0_9PLAT|nr:unnamed protein product [Protopolystoma xenopodis]